jgi:hypothetical protein
VPQPRLRYRFQTDRVGLQRSTLRLVGDDVGPGSDRAADVLTFDFDEAKGAPEQLVLGAVYAAGQLPFAVRPKVMGTLRRALRWEGPVGPDLVASLAGFSKGHEFSAFAFEHPIEWALGVMGFDGIGANGNGTGTGTRSGTGNRANGRNGAGSAPATRPPRSEVRARFRELLMDAHPDQGGAVEGAARRIADLTEARRILLTRR